MAKAAAACDRQDAGEVPPPRGSRFGSPLVLSRVHWVRPKLVVEVKYLAWTGDNLLRQVVACAKISLRPRCAARCRIQNPVR